MDLTCVVLAAGQGKRMNSSVPKVIHGLCGKPMLLYVMETIEKLRPGKKVVVVGKHHDEIKEAVVMPGISCVIQEEQKGTGDALLKAAKAIGKTGNTLLVLNGDMPLITVNTLKKFLVFHRKNRHLLSVLSFVAGDPSAYGRIIRNASGEALRIIEDKDASPLHKAIKEVNSGVYAINPKCLNLLTRLKSNKKKGEYYLTDILDIAVREGLSAGVYCTRADNEELMGINNRHELLKAREIMRHRIIDDLISKGVSFVNPSSVNIHRDVRIGRDTIIYPNVSIEGETRIGRECTIYPNVRITDSIINNNAIIMDSSVIENSVVSRYAQVGPFAHIRPGSVIGPRVKIGNFVEVKKSSIGDRTKASHLSYIGDSVVGKDVNIGAGTITCNYDGKEKHKTVIEDGVFIGSDSQLVAPVCIGRGAYIGAGSTITKDVPSMSLATSRTKQHNIEGWALKRQSKVRSSESKVKSRRDK